MPAPTPITYLVGNENITPDQMNKLAGNLSYKMERMLGGRSFLIANSNSANLNIPNTFLGKIIPFTAGRSTYAKYLPGVVLRTISITDPVSGLPVSVTGVRPYNHADFTAAASASVVASWDELKRIGNIATISDSYYTDGLVRINGISLFEHSLEAHTVEKVVDGMARRYYLKEDGSPIPEKKYVYSQAEIVIEGMTSVDLNVCPIARFKYECLRFHNLQSVSASVTMPGGAAITLDPFECRSYRLNEGKTAFVLSTHRYFQTYRGPDPRIFWYWNTIHSNSAVSTMYGITVTATGGMQGNNLANPMLFYDLIQWLTDERGDMRHCSFGRDVHELCDIAHLYKDKFKCIDATAPYATKPDRPILEMFHHVGDLTIKRVSPTLPDPRDPTGTIKLIQTDSVRFNGYDTIVADFAAKGLTVQENGSGNLEIVNTDAAWSVDLITKSTNLLKNPDYVGAGSWFVVPTARNVNTAVQIEHAVLENYGGVFGIFYDQDPYGGADFNLFNKSNYRITQKTNNVIAGASTQYRNLANVLTTVNLPSHNELTETALVAARETSGLHEVPISELLNLSFFGNPSLPSQNDAYVTYEGAKLTLTPEGWVLTFTEVIPANFIIPNTVAYQNYALRKYTLSGGAFRLKHAIRFRKHGWGCGTLGRAFAAFYTPLFGRTSVSGYTNEISGIDGTDFGFPPQGAKEMGIKFLRQVYSSEIGNPVAGGRFLTVGQHNNLDGLVQFERNDSNWLWYPQWRFAMISGDTSVPRTAGGPSARVLIALPLHAEHYNGLAQLINQLKVARPLTWKCVRIPYGKFTLTFDGENREFGENGIDGLVAWFQIASSFFNMPGAFHYEVGIGNFVRLPAPINCYGPVITTASEFSSGAHWTHFLTARGVPIKTVNDMPGFPEKRGQDNLRWPSIKVDWSASASGASFSSHGAGPIFSDFYANLTCSIDDIYFDTVDPVFSNDKAYPGYASWSFGPNRGEFDLAKYDPINWITIEDFQALMVSFGFAHVMVEHFIPLKLETIEVKKDTLQDAGIAGNDTSVTTNGVYLFSRQEQTIDEAETIGFINAVTNSGTITIGTGFSTPRKWLAFLPASTEVECEWKAVIEGSPKSFNYDNRTVGQWNESQFQLQREVRVPGIHLSVAFHIGGFYNIEASDVTSLYQNVSPWFPADSWKDSYLDGQISTGASTVINSAGPRQWMSFAIPGAGSVDAQDNHAAALNKERDWTAFQVTSSVPVSVKAFKIPQSGFKVDKDWWLDSQDAFFANRRLSQSSPAVAVPADAYSEFSIGDGLTILKPNLDEVFKVLFDPNQNVFIDLLT